MSTSLRFVIHTQSLSYNAVSFKANVDYQDGANKEWASNTPTAALEFTVRPEIAESLGYKPGTKLTAILDETKEA